MLFADVLEEARRHATTEKIIEDGGSEAAFIGKSNGGDTDADVNLFEVALGFENDGRRGCGNGVGYIEIRGRKFAEFFFDEVEYFLVRDIAGRGDEKMIGSEPVLEAAAEGFALKFANGVGCAENGAAKRVIGPEAAGEDVVEKIFRVVHVHLDFFEDDLAFFLDIFGIEFGAQDEIGENVEGNREMGVEDFGVEADLFLGSEGVEHAANGIHFAGDVFGGASLGALEDHMFEEMGGAVFGGGFPAGAVADPDANGDGTDVLHSLRDNHEAVGESVTIDIARVGDHKLLWHRGGRVASELPKVRIFNLLDWPERWGEDGQRQ